MGAGAVKDTRSRQKAHHHECCFEGIQGKELLATRHSEASPRMETPEESVLNYNEDARSPPFEAAPSMTAFF